MTTALFVIDVQNDFTEGGALAVTGGASVAARVTELLRRDRARWDVVVASRDWHDDRGVNGGHFWAEPDYVDTWPPHCVRGTTGADYHPDLDSTLVDEHVRKGTGSPAYSIFEAATESGESLVDLVARRGVTDVDVVGLATDHCVRASALDAARAGLRVRVLTDLVAGVAEGPSVAALDELRAAGVETVRS